MHKKRRVKTGFTRIKDNKLGIIAEVILNSMQSNHNFPDPVPDLSVLEKALNDYSLKLVMVNLTRSRIDAAMKNDAKRRLIKVLNELAFYVNKVADGNLTIILSSGFRPVKLKTTIVIPKKITDIKFKDGYNSGQLIFSFKNEVNAQIYEYQITQEKTKQGDLVWEVDNYTIISSSRNNLIKDLTPGENYYVRVRAINRKGRGEWSHARRWMVR